MQLSRTKNKLLKNHKGFTLVELIIVIAIIAVLAAVLAPRYLQYVERSRQSNDLQVATNIMRAATAAIADPKNDAGSDEVYTIVWSTAAATGVSLDITGTNSDLIHADVREVMGWPTASDVDTAESAAGRAQSLAFTIDSSTGQVEVDATRSSGWIDEIGLTP